MTLEDLKRLEELEAKASEGPWIDDGGSIHDESSSWIADANEYTDRELIVALRNAAPQLLTLARQGIAARALVKAVEAFDDEDATGEWMYQRDAAIKSFEEAVRE